MRYLFISILLLVLQPKPSLAWDDKKTHSDLSEKAVEFSMLSSERGDYLDVLGFRDNINEIFKVDGVKLKVRQWFRHGGLMEDESYKLFGEIKIEPVGRFYNHFHNPLVSFDDAGLDSIVNGKSALLWAQDEAENEWAWQRLRAYYRLALTSPLDTERSANFARTFRGLGQIVHLIQDMSQPAHVRNDSHPADNKGIIPGFEWWAKQPENNTLMNSYMTTPIRPDVPLNVSKKGKLPISQFWDTDQYTQTSGPLAGNSNGLAEYTNAHFFSEDTIFHRRFPHPSFEQTNAKQIETLAEDGQTDLPWYVTSEDNDDPIAVYSYFEKPLKEMRDSDAYDPSETNLEWGYMLDEKVYSTYAQKLIPRAVGYSAALIDYFFRGKIDLSPDPSNPGYYRITNESDEDMSGIFKLYYDDKNGNRKEVATPAEWELSIAAKGVSPPVTFDAPSDATDTGNYMLVFQGTQGAEEGAVAGRNIILRTQTLPYIFVHTGPYTSGVVWDFARDQEVILKDPENKELIAPYSKYAAETSLGVKFESPTPSFETIDSGCGGLDCMFKRNGDILEPNSNCYNLLTEKETGELIKNGNRVSSCGATYITNTNPKGSGSYSEGGSYSTEQTINFESSGETFHKGKLPNPNSGIAPSEFVTKQKYEELVSTTKSWTTYEQQVEEQSTSSNRALLMASTPNAGNLVMDINGTRSRNSRYQKYGWRLVMETCEESGNYVLDVREPYARAGGKIWTDKGRAWYIETAQIHYNYWMTFFRNDFYSCYNHFADSSEVLFDDIKQVFWVQLDRKQINRQEGEAGWDYQWSAFKPIALEKIKDILARNSNFHRNKHEIFFYAVLAE